MADTKVSALTAAASALPSHELPVNEGGTSKKLTVDQLTTLIGVRDNFSTANQTINAATTALITGSTLAVPASKLAIGTVLMWKLTVSKTAAGTAANTFLVKIGTAGTTADATILTFTLPTATAVVDVAKIEIMCTVRGPLSASCILQGNLWLGHNLSATGFATIPNVCLNVTSGAFDATTANLIASVACTTAASTVLTFQQCSANSHNL